MFDPPAHFTCPDCEATYKVVLVEAAPTNDREITCIHCRRPLVSREGRFLLKYFLVDRPGKRKHTAR